MSSDCTRSVYQKRKKIYIKDFTYIVNMDKIYSNIIRHCIEDKQAADNALSITLRTIIYIHKCTYRQYIIIYKLTLKM